MDLDTHIADVANLLRWEDLHGAVLCGHSYGGLVVTGAADQVPERVAAVVYADAFVPRDGQSMLDMLPPGRPERVRRDAARHGEGWRMTPIPAADFDLADAADRAWVDRLCTPHPLATCTQRLRLSGARHSHRRAFVLAEGYRVPTFRPFHAAAAADPGWSTHTLPCGHELMIEHPDELAVILESTAS